MSGRGSVGAPASHNPKRGSKIMWNLLQTLSKNLVLAIPAAMAIGFGGACGATFRG